MTPLRDPFLPESHVACPECGAQVGFPCHGIEVHPEHGPMGLHVARMDAARATGGDDMRHAVVAIEPLGSGDR